MMTERGALLQTCCRRGNDRCRACRSGWLHADLRPDNSGDCRARCPLPQMWESSF